MPGGGPKPLRSNEFPMGLPTLQKDSPEDFDRVQNANKLYDFTARCCLILLGLRVAWSIENPLNSILWLIPVMARLLANGLVHQTVFQHCAYGGDRPKKTLWAFFPSGLFNALAAQCPGERPDHIHAPWGRTAMGGYATALETVYPDALCVKVASLLFEHMQCTAARPLPILRVRGGLHEKRHRIERQAAARQPRGGRSRRILPEFAQTLSIRSSFRPGDPRLVPGYTWKACTIEQTSIPEGAKTIRTFYGGGAGDTSIASSGSSSSSTLPPPSSRAPVPSAGSSSSSSRTPPPTWAPAISSSSSSSPSSHTSSSPGPLRVPTRACIRDVPELGEHDVYIGREHRSRTGRFLAASPLANPFKVRDSASVHACIVKFDAHLRASPALLAMLPGLCGKRLVCNCHQNAPCHGDSIIGAFTEFVIDQPALDSTILVGIFASVVDFTTAASACDHPFDCAACPRPVLEALPFRMTSSTSHVVSFRREVMCHWRSRARALESREAALHAAMHPAVECIMRNKKLLLFKEMLREISFEKADDLVHFMTTGFPLVGQFPATGVLPPATRAAAQSVEDLWASAGAAQARAAAKSRASGDPQLDKELFDATILERDRGWLEGPLSPVELKSLGAWVPSRRFGIRQGRKLRAIDDLHDSGINDALAATETIDPTDIDGIVSNARLHADAFSIPAACRSATSPLTGVPRHSDVEGDTLQGRLFDLSSAYKNLAVRPADHALSIISVWSPEKNAPELFLQRALPFGASAAVLAFYWVAIALHAYLTRGLRLGCTHFYDDFVFIERGALTESVTEIVTDFFTLLGWDLKDLPGFSELFHPLGATIDLSQAAAGKIVVGNKQERVDNLISDMSAVISTGTVEQKALLRLRGRLLFARSLCFGRFGACALRALNRSCSPTPFPTAPTDARYLTDALYLLRETLAEAPSRCVPVAYEPPVLLFTDGACEVCNGAITGTIGAVLLDPRESKYEFIAGELSPEAMRELTSASANPIIQIELLAVAAAMSAWGHIFRGRAVIVFIDNDASRACLVAGSAREFLSSQVVQAVCSSEIEAKALMWYERVPSHSNIADDPSRGLRPARLEGWPAPEVCSGWSAALFRWGVRELTDF